MLKTHNIASSWKWLDVSDTAEGQCYTREALIGLMKFCQSRQIHFISDEIYGLSPYEKSDSPSEKFVSVLSIDISQYIDPNLVRFL